MCPAFGLLALVWAEPSLSRRAVLATVRRTADAFGETTTVGRCANVSVTCAAGSVICTFAFLHVYRTDFDDKTECGTALIDALCNHETKNTKSRAVSALLAWHHSAA